MFRRTCSCVLMFIYPHRVIIFFEFVFCLCRVSLSLSSSIVRMDACSCGHCAFCALCFGGVLQNFHRLSSDLRCAFRISCFSFAAFSRVCHFDKHRTFLLPFDIFFVHVANKIHIHLYSSAQPYAAVVNISRFYFLLTWLIEVDVTKSLMREYFKTNERVWHGFIRLGCKYMQCIQES